MYGSINAAGGGGSKVTVDGEKIKEPLSLIRHNDNFLVGANLVGTTGYAAQSVVILDGETYLIEGNNMLKVDGKTVKQICTYPVDNVNTYCPFIHNGELHILSAESDSLYKYSVKDNAWTSIATLPHRYIDAGCSCDGNIYVLGSSQSWYRNKIYRLNSDGSWTQLAAFSLGYNMPVFTRPGKIIVLGYQYSSSEDKLVHVYDIASNKWSSTNKGYNDSYITDRHSIIGVRDNLAYFTSNRNVTNGGWGILNLDTYEIMEDTAGVPDSFCTSYGCYEDIGRLFAAISDSSTYPVDLYEIHGIYYTEAWG